MASKQVRQLDLDMMHPAYKRPGVNPFGDSVLPTFQSWLSMNENILREMKYNP
jgi:hypothetical protein